MGELIDIFKNYLMILAILQLFTIITITTGAYFSLCSHNMFQRLNSKGVTFNKNIISDAEIGPIGFSDYAKSLLITSGYLFISLILKGNIFMDWLCFTV